MKIMLTQLFVIDGHRNFQGDLIARAIERNFEEIRAVCTRVPDVDGKSQIMVSSDHTITKKEFTAMQEFGAGYLAAIKDADDGLILSNS